MRSDSVSGGLRWKAVAVCTVTAGSLQRGSLANTRLLDLLDYFRRDCRNCAHLYKNTVVIHSRLLLLSLVARERCCTVPSPPVAANRTCAGAKQAAPPAGEAGRFCHTALLFHPPALSISSVVNIFASVKWQNLWKSPCEWVRQKILQPVSPSGNSLCTMVEARKQAHKSACRVRFPAWVGLFFYLFI